MGFRDFLVHRTRGRLRGVGSSYLRWRIKSDALLAAFLISPMLRPVSKLQRRLFAETFPRRARCPHATAMNLAPKPIPRLIRKSTPHPPPFSWLFCACVAFRLNRSSLFLGSVHNDCDASGANRTRRNLCCHHGLNATSPVSMHFCHPPHVQHPRH